MKIKSAKKPATIASTARKMIIAGKSNAQIYSALRLTHKLPAEKKWYVGWFRAECRRKGLIAPTIAPLSDEAAAA